MIDRTFAQLSRRQHRAFQWSQRHPGHIGPPADQVVHRAGQFDTFVQVFGEIQKKAIS
jgi:hypothetical protein